MQFININLSWKYISRFLAEDAVVFRTNGTTEAKILKK
jgi:hypothetical protein